MKLTVKQLKALILEEIEAFPPRGNKKVRTPTDDARVERRAVETAKRRADRKAAKEAKGVKNAPTVCKEQVEEISAAEMQSSYEEPYFPAASSRNTPELDAYRSKELRHDKLTKELKKLIESYTEKEFEEALASAKRTAKLRKTIRL